MVLERIREMEGKYMNPYEFIMDIKETNCTMAQCALQKALIE